MEAFLATGRGESMDEPPEDTVDSEAWYRRVREEDHSPRLWRYMSFSQFAFILQTKTLYFPSLLELSREDPWEGRSRLQDTVEADRTPIDAPVSKTMGELARKAYEDTRVSCWHMNHTESYGMWKAYLKTTEGVAVQTTVDGLSAALMPPYPLAIDSVSYVDDNDLRLDRAAHLYKRREFEYEQEVRAHFLSGRFGGITTIRVATDLLIQTLAVDPWSPPWFQELLSNLMARYGLGYVPVSKSSIAQAPSPRGARS